MILLIKKYLRGYAALLAVLAPCLMFLEVFMDLQQPTLMSDIIDNGVAAGNLNYVIDTGLKMVMYALLGLIGGAGCGICATYAAVNMGGKLRNSLFAHIQSLSFAEIDKLKTSSLITRITNDIMQVQNMVMMLLRSIRAPMLCIGGVIMSFVLSPKLALVLCVSLPVLIAFTYLIIRKTIPMYTILQDNIDKINTVMRENLLGVRVVKAFTMENKQFKRFTAANDELAAASIEAQTSTFLMMPVVTLIMNLSIVAILWFGGNMEIAGSLPTGRIMAFINYMVQITNSLVMLVNFIMNFSRAHTSAKRINEVFSTKPAISEAIKTCEPKGSDIEFANVYFRYGSTGDYVLHDLTFSIKQGKKVGIIGATGCGKSTLVSLIGRLYDATSGSITIGGANIKDIPLKTLRTTIGMVLQESLLFSGTVEENLRYGNETASDEDIRNAAKAAAALEFIEMLPQKFKSVVEQRGKNFSGGQKQRLSIARTLLRKPEIIILDDSTSAVDFATEAKLQTAIWQMMSDKTIILVAQRISAVMNCDIIIALDKGRLAGIGSHSELMKSCEIYRSIAISQLGEEAIKYA